MILYLGVTVFSLNIAPRFTLVDIPRFCIFYGKYIMVRTFIIFVLLRAGFSLLEFFVFSLLFADE